VEPKATANTTTKSTIPTEPTLSDNFFWKNLKTLHTYKDRNDRGYELRVGHWIIDGVQRDAILVKQEFKETVSGQIIWGKAKGLDAKDMYRIFGMAAELSILMRFPLPPEFSAQLSLLQTESVEK